MESTHLLNKLLYCPGMSAVDAAGLNGATISVSAHYVEGTLAGAAIDNNQFFAGGSAATVFGNPTGLDFWPQPGSALLGVADAGYMPGFDFNESVRTTAYDVGAYETEGQTTNPGWQVSEDFKATSGPPDLPEKIYLPLILR